MAGNTVTKPKGTAVGAAASTLGDLRTATRSDRGGMVVKYDPGLYSLGNAGLTSRDPGPPDWPKPVVTQPYDSTADQAAAARQAQIDSLSNGRVSTQAGGNIIAADEQYNRGLLRQKQRMAAATDILG